jgi:hypothetical protein
MQPYKDRLSFQNTQDDISYIVSLAIFTGCSQRYFCPFLNWGGLVQQNGSLSSLHEAFP